MKFVHSSCIVLFAMLLTSCKEESMQNSGLKNNPQSKDFAVNLSQKNNRLLLIATPKTEITAEGIKICVGSKNHCNNQAINWVQLQTAKLSNQKISYIAEIPMGNIQQSNLYLYAKKATPSSNGSNNFISRSLQITMNSLNNSSQNLQNSTPPSSTAPNLEQNNATNATIPPLAVKAESLLNQKVGNGDCYAFVSGLTNKNLGRQIGSSPDAVKANTILFMKDYGVRSDLGYSKSSFQHYVYVSSVSADRIATIYHQNSNRRQYVVKGWMDLKTFNGRSMTVYQPPM